MKAYQYIRMEIYGSGTGGQFSLPQYFSMNKILMGSVAADNILVTNSLLAGVVATTNATGATTGGTGLAGLTDTGNATAGNWYQAGSPLVGGVRVPLSRANPVWLRWNLAAPVVIQKIMIYATTSFSSYVPNNFAILGSNDGINWESIVYFNQYVIENNAAIYHTRTFSNEIKGEVKAVTGTVKVQVFSVVNGVYTHVATAIPGTDGKWQTAVDNVNSHAILYMPDEQGIRPMADGIVIPTAYV